MGAEEANGLVVVPEPRPRKGLTSWALDLLESVAVRLGHDKAKPLHWLSGNFAPVVDETPPAPDLPVRGHLPVLTMLPPFPLPISFFLLHIIMLLPKLKQPFFFESIKQPISPRTCGTYSRNHCGYMSRTRTLPQKKNSFLSGNPHKFFVPISCQVNTKSGSFPVSCTSRLTCTLVTLTTQTLKK